jgi:hypothetical protein
MSASTRYALVSLVALSWLAAGCGSPKKTDLGGGCTLNSDCNSPLVCTFGKCHTACVQTRDCPLGQSCVMAAGGSVCQLPAEADCRAATCEIGTVCAVDYHCRTVCQSPIDCTPLQACVSNVCADPTDLDPNGQLPPETPPSIPDAGAPDTASADIPAVSPAEASIAESGPEASTTNDSSSPDRSVDSSRDSGIVEIHPEVGADVLRDMDPAADGGSAPVPCTGKPLTITYDGTTTPDSTALAALFSTQVSSGASWSASGGELVLRTSPSEFVWFGNHASYDPVSWPMAPTAQGNSVSIRGKLGGESQGFHVYLTDEGVQSGGIFFMPGYVMLRTGTDDYARQDIDTSTYHTYLIATGNGRLSYSIDGVEVSSQALQGSQAPGGQLIIGDGNYSRGPLGWETGTFHIDDVTIRTFTSCVALE